MKKIKKFSLLFATTLFLTTITTTVYAENSNIEETSVIETVENIDKKNSVNSVSIFVEKKRMYTSNASIPTSLYVSEVYNGYIYRGTIYLKRVERVTGGNYMAYYSGNIPKTPIMGRNKEIGK